MVLFCPFRSLIVFGSHPLKLYRKKSSMIILQNFSICVPQMKESWMGLRVSMWWKNSNFWWDILLIAVLNVLIHPRYFVIDRIRWAYTFFYSSWCFFKIICNLGMRSSQLLGTFGYGIYVLCNVTINQLSCTKRFKTVNQIYVYQFKFIWERTSERERERDWSLQQSGSLPRAPLHPVNKQNTGQLNITFPFMSRPQERERGRQMRYCGSNMPTWDACSRNSPEVKLSRASRGQACPFLSSHSGMFVSEDFVHPLCLSDSSFLVFD